MPNRPLTNIDRLAALLIHHAGPHPRLGQTGTRITIAPFPATENTHKHAHTIDITSAGLANIVTILTAAMTAQAGTEDAA